ncbi:MAG TPA: hypothetical protein V6D20_08610 [Candidatus Obscuribacterales bacterium]
MFYPVCQVDKFGGVILSGLTKLGLEGLHFFVRNPGHEEETQLEAFFPQDFPDAFFDELFEFESVHVRYPVQDLTIVI